MGSAVSNYILFTLENITRRCGLSPSFYEKITYIERMYGVIMIVKQCT